MSRSSSSSYLRFVDLEYQPLESDVIAVYRVVRNPNTRLKGLAFLGAIAAEASTGTWIEVSGNAPACKDPAGMVFAYNEISEIAKIAFPIELFELGNLSQFLTIVAGNAFGLSDVSALKLLDVILPKVLTDSFAGPRYGIQGIYEMLNLQVGSRPILGSIIKPKVGLTLEQHAQVCYQAWAGEFSTSKIDGVDMVKDDEALTHHPQLRNDFYKRVDQVITMLKKAEDVTGKPKIYIPNVTSSNVSESIRRAEYVTKKGGKAVMVDYVIGGGILLHSLRAQNLPLIIHGHRTLSAALNRAKDFGLSYNVWTKIFRMVGGDQVHTGTPGLGVMSASRTQVLETFDICRQRTNEFVNHNTVLPICGAGLDPLLVQPLTMVAGNTLAIFAGGGIHGHPMGTAAGASSMRLAVLGIEKKITTEASFANVSFVWAKCGYDFFKSFDKQNPNDGAREQV